MASPHDKHWRQLVVPVLLLCLAGLAGCGPRGPDVQYVEGVVTLAGKPLEHATVCYFPVGDGLSAAGITDKDGRYRLNSPRARPTAGALIGDYVITVTQYDDPVHTFRPAPTDPEGFARWQNDLSEHVRKREGKPPPLLTPEKYSKPETSPLKATVKKGRNTGPEFSFDLR